MQISVRLLTSNSLSKAHCRSLKLVFMQALSPYMQNLFPMALTRQPNYLNIFLQIMVTLSTHWVMTRPYWHLGGSGWILYGCGYKSHMSSLSQPILLLIFIPGWFRFYFSSEHNLVMYWGCEISFSLWDWVYALHFQQLSCLLGLAQVRISLEGNFWHTASWPCPAFQKMDTNSWGINVVKVNSLCRKR